MFWSILPFWVSVYFLKTVAGRTSDCPKSDILLRSMCHHFAENKLNIWQYAQKNCTGLQFWFNIKFPWGYSLKSPPGTKAPAPLLRRVQQLSQARLTSWGWGWWRFLMITSVLEQILVRGLRLCEAFLLRSNLNWLPVPRRQQRCVCCKTSPPCLWLRWCSAAAKQLTRHKVVRGQAAVLWGAWGQNQEHRFIRICHRVDLRSSVYRIKSRGDWKQRRTHQVGKRWEKVLLSRTLSDLW